MSWTGQFLRIDLTTGSIKTEALNTDWARRTWASADWPPSTSWKRWTPKSIRCRRPTS